MASPGKRGALPLPAFDAPAPKLLLVAAPFYRAIAADLIAGAKAAIAGAGADADLVEVPGALEIPAAIRLASKHYEGFVALGCVIRGETTHYETVCNDSSRGLTLLGLEGICIGNGILTCETADQARARADPTGMNKGGGAAAAALHLVALARRFRPPTATETGSDPARPDRPDTSRAMPGPQRAENRAPATREAGSRASSPKRTEERLARSAARLAAVQALYQIEMTGADWRAVATEFDEHRLGTSIEGAQYREADPRHFRRIVAAVIDRQDSIDKMTDGALVEGWPLGRIDMTLRALFRAAGAELVAFGDVPPKVIIGEYVDVARAFFPEGKETGLVNAVLDRMARDSRPGALG